MFFPPELFRIGRELPADFEAIAAETAMLGDGRFAAWPDRDAYSDGWLVMPLVLDESPEGFEPDIAGNRDLCPRTVAILARYPEIITAGVSRLLPGAHIYPHVDVVKPSVYRYHLTLRASGTAGLRDDVETLTCSPGTGMVLDHRQLHESANLGDRPRDVFLVDFVASPAELAAVEAWRGGRIDARPTRAR
ncbi:MAG: aspartyl/asparaginyl beta-hydroxylase domain-containing protein [Planctomycetota bacterium]